MLETGDAGTQSISSNHCQRFLHLQCDMTG